jgi:predicted NUDIX family NTP pyrophosphohydrolase
MPKKSAGILMYRLEGNALSVFLVHPGGPYWEKKDAHSWSIPKGLYDDEENPLAAAKREFQEETGFACDGTFEPLGDIRQPSGKIISAWALEGDCDPDELNSNTFSMEWPRRSGRRCEFPEVDRGEWFTIEVAARKIRKGQLGFLRVLCSLLGLTFPAA